MRAVVRFTILMVLVLVVSCAGPPKSKLDRLYRALQELLPPFDTAALSGRVVVIDPGHGGLFRGTAGPDSLEEAAVNLGVALYLGGLLRESGAAVHYTRSADRDFLTPEDSTVAFDLEHRVAMVDSLKPDIFISIHHNAQSNRDKKINIVETYYRFGDPASRDLAFSVHRHLMRNLGISSGEVRQGNYLVLRSVEVPAILGEASYLTDPGVEKKLRLSEKQKLEAEAYFLGILDYFQRGTPRLRPLAPGETTLTSIPEIVFASEDVGGIGIDPDAITMSINGKSIRAAFNSHKNCITYPMPWNSPNGDYEVTLGARNLMGNSSPEAAMRFSINLLPERAVFQPVPDSLPPEGGTVRFRVLLLDRRGLEISEGTPIAIGTTLGETLPEAFVREGYIEFPVTVPASPGSIEVTISCSGRRFSYTLKESSRPMRAAFNKVLIVDASTGSPLLDATVAAGDNLLQSGSRSGYYFIPLVTDSMITIRAHGYHPADIHQGLPDTLKLRPWFGGALHAKRIVIDPQGGPPGSTGAGKLGLPASYVNLQVAQYLAAYLDQAGARTLLSRTSEETLSPQDVVALTNAFAADRYIEIRHSQSPLDPPTLDPGAIKGFYFPGSEKGKAMASAVARTFAMVCGIPSQEIAEQVTYPLQQTACPAIVVEAPSISEIKEELRLDEPWYLRQQAYSIFLGILDHFDAPNGSEVTVEIITDGEKANWLVTLDGTWKVLTSPDGLGQFFALGTGAHHITARREGETADSHFEITGKEKKTVPLHPVKQSP